MKRKCLVLLLLLFSINSIFSVTWEIKNSCLYADLETQIISSKQNRTITAKVEINKAYTSANLLQIGIVFYEKGEKIDFTKTNGASYLSVAADIISNNTTRYTETVIYSDYAGFYNYNAAYIMSQLFCGHDVTIKLYIDGNIYQFCIPSSQELINLIKEYTYSDQFNNLGTWVPSGSNHDTTVFVKYGNYANNKKDSIIDISVMTDPGKNYDHTSFFINLYYLLPGEFGYEADYMSYFSIQNSIDGYTIKPLANMINLDEPSIKTLIKMAEEENTLYFTLKFENDPNEYKIILQSKDFIKYLTHPIRFMY